MKARDFFNQKPGGHDAALLPGHATEELNRQHRNAEANRQLGGKHEIIRPGDRMCLIGHAAACGTCEAFTRSGGACPGMAASTMPACHSSQFQPEGEGTRDSALGTRKETAGAA
jgi:hypothetical protein